MQFDQLSQLFPGIGSLFELDPSLSLARIALMIFGMFIVFLGKRGTLEPLLMIPMGLGMTAVNAGYLSLGAIGNNLFVNPMTSEPGALMTVLQIDFLQPLYNFAFSNGLIACIIFMGIGVLLDVGFVIARPFESLFLALCAELGTILIFPIASWIGYSPGEAASVALIGGADGPMVLFGSLVLAKDLFVPITVVAYLYLGLTYAGYPLLIKILIPKRLRGKPIPKSQMIHVSSGQKLAVAVVLNLILCILFPVAAPLFVSLFLGIAVREAGLAHFVKVIEGTFLYGATLFLGFMLGVLCEAGTMLSPKVLTLLLLGMLALLISGIGGIIGGYILYFIKRGNYNPVVGIAAVSCVPSTAKIAQKSVNEVDSSVMILPEALGANISGVITTAIVTGVYVALLFKG